MSAKARVYFALLGDDFDPDEVTKELGVAPTAKNKTGEPGRYKPRLDFSSWELSTDEVETLDVYELANQICDQLAGKSAAIRRLVEKYSLEATLEIVLWIDTNEKQPAPALGFDDKVISFLHAVGGQIDIDIYRFDSSRHAE